MLVRRTPLGILTEPGVPVEVLRSGRYRRHWFLLDTGATCSLAPRWMADEAGLDWESLPSMPILGVDLVRVPARLGRLPVRIGTVEFAMRCCFAEHYRTPLLLGRADFLDRFVVTIDQPRRKILLDPG